MRHHALTSRRWFRFAMPGLIALASLAMPFASAAKEGTPVAVPADCPVTAPLVTDDAAVNGGPPPVEPGWYLNEYIGASVVMWGEAGIVHVPPSHVTASGETLGMKWAWWRFAEGRLEIEGRQLDGDGVLQAHIPEGYGSSGFQVTGLIFSGPGCWEVTGRLADVVGSELTFVLWVQYADPAATPAA